MIFIRSPKIPILYHTTHILLPLLHLKPPLPYSLFAILVEHEIMRNTRLRWLSILSSCLFHGTFLIKFDVYVIEES